MNWKASLRRLKKWLQSDDGWALQVCMVFVVTAYLFGYCTSWAGTRLDMRLKDYYLRQLTQSWLQKDDEVRGLRELAASQAKQEKVLLEDRTTVSLEISPTGDNSAIQGRDFSPEEGLHYRYP